MKFGVIALGTIGLLGLSSAAWAQTPKAHTGFQMDIRTGYSIPLGTLEGGANGSAATKMSDAVSGQVPFMLDIGGKVIPELFIGGYLGFGVGGAGSNCPNCSSVGLHVGAEVQYHILPAGFVNPWVGYGIGIESLAVGDNTSVGWGGFEFARFMGGADFRINKIFGVGPFVDLSMASFSTFSDTQSNSHDINQTGIHEWLTLGVRFVFFP
ncbi:MAG TPA: hypothetical protein VFK05_03670 [Polyangiaceae bacterium]|nr:hypothetical protein [Polyangiaceae bacterium]